MSLGGEPVRFGEASRGSARAPDYEAGNEGIMEWDSRESRFPRGSFREKDVREGDVFP